MTFCRLARTYAQYFPFIRVTCGEIRTDRLHVLKHLMKDLYYRALTVRKSVLIRLGLYHKLRKFLKRE